MKKGSTIVLIVAAGLGIRMGEKIPKQYLPLNGKYLLTHTIRAFISHPLIDGVKVVINPSHKEYYYEAVKGLDILPPCYGGGTRQESVRLGLTDLKNSNAENVLIHDAARPFVDKTLIDEILKLLDTFEAVDVGCDISSTLRFKNNTDIPLDRDKIYSVQTPQGFKFNKIIKLHNKYINEGWSDDISLALKEGIKVGLAKGNNKNFKITTLEDWQMAEHLMKENYHNRVGLGYDVHKIAFTNDENNTIPIAGVHIPSQYKVIAHSDGDVAIHSIMDALLGAVSEGDIGHHFAPSDDKFKGIDSKLLLKEVKKILDKKNAIIENIDCTIIAETPKIKDYSHQMKLILAEILFINHDQISIKATTSEKLGFIGRKEGIAAQAICSIKVKNLDEIRSKI